MFTSSTLCDSPPTFTSAGQQWAVSTSIGCKLWLSLAKPTLKWPHVGTNCSLMACTMKCGWAISPKPSWQSMWQGLKVEVLNLKHPPSHRYLEMRQACRTLKIVASSSCGWLLLGFSYEGARSSMNKSRGKNRWVVRHLTLLRKHVIAW